MDELDRQLLRLLQLDGRASFRELADSVTLSPNAVAERVRKLRTSGVISGIHAHVDPAATGRGMRAYLDVFLAAGVQGADFEAMALAIDGVMEVAHVTGRADYVMAVAVRDAADLDRLLGELKADRQVAATESRIVLRRAGSTIPLP